MLNTHSLLLVHIAMTMPAWAAQFSSHISVMTPASSFTHGVGDLRSGVSELRSGFSDRGGGRRYFQTQGSESISRFSSPPAEDSQDFGYPRVRPAIPFNFEEQRIPSRKFASRQFIDSSGDTLIPLLPLSPYKVDSPDPESLWPEGLFLPPLPPHNQRSRLRAAAEETAESNSVYDPYLLEGSAAVAAVHKAQEHGFLYFHDIPHIRSLLENQELRAANRLAPHRVASIRQTWPYNRP